MLDKILVLYIEQNDDWLNDNPNQNVPIFLTASTNPKHLADFINDLRKNPVELENLLFNDNCGCLDTLKLSINTDEKSNHICNIRHVHDTRHGTIYFDYYISVHALPLNQPISCEDLCKFWRLTSDEENQKAANYIADLLDFSETT